uniref:PCI domain-containing protein n=1 Tax=Aegilops tauschii subsp. strangulata TaxID=200361 RepID=A0A453CVV7_AEGTS
MERRGGVRVRPHRDRNRSSSRCSSSPSSWPGRKEGKGSGGDQAMAAPLEFLEAQGSTRPELAEWYAALADLYQRKLWHQLTLKLDQFLALAVVQAGDALIQLYTHFISDFESKINLLKFAHFAVVVSRQYSDKDAGISYLEGVISKLHDTKESRVEEPILYVKMQIASFLLEKGNQKECKKLVDEGKTTLDSMDDVDPSVHSTYYWLCSQYHKVCQDYSEFYKNALLYLAYTTVESLSEPFKQVLFAYLLFRHEKLDLMVAVSDSNNCLQNLAFDLSLAALLGDNIYNFGELLAHPIIHSLVGTPVEWIYHILQAFNSGNLASYQELCKVHAAALSAQPALVQKERELLEKINILCLMEIIFSRASQDRTIPLSTIAEQTRLSVEDVEYLLMKSLSAHLIEGIIDGVDGTVHVSWAQPRVLGIDQVKSLRDRLDTWVGKVTDGFVAE